MRLLIASLLLLGGCYRGVVLSPTSQIKLDASFTPAEMEQMLAGIASWEQTAAGVHFDVTLVDHETLIQATSPPGVYRMVRVDGPDDPRCTVMTETRVGATNHFSASMACFYAASFPLDELARGAAHEMGHQFGLHHVEDDSVASIMHHHTALDTLVPTCGDVENAGLTCVENATRSPK